VRDVVMSAMAKNPAARPQGAHVLASLMEDLRLRRLAGDPELNGRGAPPPNPFAAWPADAATPPRGSHVAAHASHPGSGAGAVGVPMRVSTRSLPAGRGSGRKRRRLTVPLAALIALIALVAAGTVWANRSQGAEPPASSVMRPDVTTSQSTEPGGTVTHVARHRVHVQGSPSSEPTSGGTRTTSGWTR
jgi:hypothetical protein